MYETGFCNHIDRLVDEEEIFVTLFRRYMESVPGHTVHEAELEPIRNWAHQTIVAMSLLHGVLKGEFLIQLEDGEVKFDVPRGQ